MTQRVLGLLHTGESHRARFDRLLRELAPPAVAWVEQVREPLLKAAMQGVPASNLAGRVEATMAELRDEGADQILCTCSSLGGLAEEAGRRLGVPTLRVDRPMAEAAVAAGPRILVAASVRSTLGPTTALLQEIADARQQRVEIETLMIENAWPLFEAGDEAGFARRIAQAIRKAPPRYDAIVLAQASMAAAADLVEDVSVPVLGSPRLGVAAALRRLTAAAARADTTGRMEQGQAG